MSWLGADSKSSRLAPGCDEILIPGEPEFRKAALVEKEGIDIDERTWGQIVEEGKSFGVDTSRWETRTRCGLARWTPVGC